MSAPVPPPHALSLPPPYFSVGQPLPPAVPPRQVRRRPRRPAVRVKLNSQTDHEVWHKSDEEIIAAALASWPSPVYPHYIVTLVRYFRIDPDTGSEVPDYLEYVFTCKTDPDRHAVLRRRRDRTHDGTGNLKVLMEACKERNNVAALSDQPASTPFLYAMHLAIIVMLCAYHYLPFAGVLHDLIRRHVQLLRPGTTMPNNTTVSRTTRYIYEKQGLKVREYFKGIETIHLALDGWTAPTATAYLGLVVHWYSEGKLWRAVLEMIRLERKHTGEYLAQKTTECLWRYGLGEKLHTICMDNASNNDTFTRHLPTLIPKFGGPRSRVRCAAHVINLVVKAFTAYFMSPVRRKRKNIKVEAKSVRKRRRGNGTSTDQVDDKHETIVVDGSDEGAETDSDDESGKPDGGFGDAIDAAKALYDDYVIKSTSEKALKYARKELGLDISEAKLTSARAILTKVMFLDTLKPSASTKHFSRPQNSQRKCMKNPNSSINLMAWLIKQGQVLALTGVPWLDVYLPDGTQTMSVWRAIKTYGAV
ncbi:Putative AC transposase AltName: Full=ORFA [Rhizoctonia solani AG-1 IB]|uniref:Rhizoctonia solani AG1-IB WGS project CAOJ00000000 data, isolate 7/3/14, contig 16275 n=1 Tax=Thanatephorus cucumeris (strain AG1-IB / isolate 7/3/14) TaxID=1108050 RepID=M5BZZ3_THACB|nr:Putative AC transposase AltName: Full=ORFA [Rhizoctonia solani AG-1 IB]